MTDNDLLQKYRQSEQLEFLSRLYERYVELVFGICLKYLPDEKAAEDAVMDIFEQLGPKVLAHDIKNFKSWLYTTSRNHCLMQIRAEKKDKSEYFDPSIMYSEEKWHPIQEEEEEAKLPIESLNECIESLPDGQRNCIKKFYVEEMTYKDIADELQLELGKVRSYIQNGRRNLRICVEQKTVQNESGK